MDLILRTFCFAILCLGYINADPTAVEVLDATFKIIEHNISMLASTDLDLLKKHRQLEEEIKILKLAHGPCSPCRSITGTKAYCDCRHLEGKQDCREFYDAGVRVNGLYQVEVPSRFSTITTYCDQTTQNGGWMVIMRRKDGSVDFNQNWEGYKYGFGKLGGEFWLGNDNIHDLTKSSKNPNSSQMLINLKIKGQSNPVWAKYGSFGVGNETSKYVLKISGFSGNTTESLSTFHNAMKFTTIDQDNDTHSSGLNCAVHGGGWWFRNCFRSFLTGPYVFSNTTNQAIIWQYWQDGRKTQPEFVEMKVRRN